MVHMETTEQQDPGSSGCVVVAVVVAEVVTASTGQLVGRHWMREVVHPLGLRARLHRLAAAAAAAGSAVEEQNSAVDVEASVVVAAVAVVVVAVVDNIGSVPLAVVLLVPQNMVGQKVQV